MESGLIKKRDSGKLCLVAVHKRTQTLMEIITEWIEPGTTIIADCWKGYNHDVLTTEGFNHLTFYHSLNFVDPDTGTHTNTIESTWRHVKSRFPQCNSQLASLHKNNALREIKLRLSYLQGKSTTMSVIAHQTEKEWISANKKSRQRMSQTQAEGAAEQHADRLEDAHLRAHHSCFTTSERC
ncbi:putative transposase-like protein [Trichonephila clavipes]|nr:putative transposase-like protein [Trichonephila clavipes]